MPASLKSIRDRMKVSRSAKDKATVLTVKVSVYDNGMVLVDDRPTSGRVTDTGQIDAATLVMQTLHEFFVTEVPKRRKATLPSESSL